MFDSIKRYANLIVIGALCVGLMVQTVRLADSKSDTAHQVALLEQEKGAAQKLRAERFQLQAETTTKLAKQAAEHATKQQEITHAFNQKLRIRDARDRDAATVTAGLQRDIAAYAAGGSGEQSGSDRQACRAEADRAVKLGALLAEGVELVTESQGVIAGRDAEVVFLLNLIQNDQATQR